MIRFLVGVALFGIALASHALQRSSHTIVFHGGGTSMLHSQDNHPGAFNKTTGTTFVIGGDSNKGAKESVIVNEIAGRSPHTARIAARYVGGDRVSECSNNQVPSGLRNPENLARGQAAPYGQLCAKSYGITSIHHDASRREVMWAWFSPGNGAVGYRSSTLMESTNRGKTWVKSYTVRGKGVIHPSFMTAGPGYTDTGLPASRLENGRQLKDRWVYMTFAGFAPTDKNNLSMQLPGRVYLCRKDRRKMSVSRVRCYAGRRNGRAVWRLNDLAKPGPIRATSIYTDRRGVSWSGASLQFVDGWYLLITEHSATMRGKLKFGLAKRPWGPYRQALVTKDFGRCTGSGGSNAFFARHDSMWSRALKRDTGRNWLNVLVYTGIGDDDALKTVQYSIQPRGHRLAKRC